MRKTWRTKSEIIANNPESKSQKVSEFKYANKRIPYMHVICNISKEFVKN